MGSRMKPAEGAMTLAEMKEFAGFPAATQRYIRRALDIGLDREDAMTRWSRDIVEAASIRAQARLYGRLPDVRTAIPDDSGLDSVEPLLGPLLTLTAFDLGQGRLLSFSAYRFLYERLLGASVRPWLPAAFCAAAALPQRCRTCTRNCGASCSSRSAKPPRPPRAGRPASRRSSLIGSRRSIPPPCRTDPARVPNPSAACRLADVQVVAVAQGRRARAL